MKLNITPFDLKLARRWAIASRLGPGGAGGTETFAVLFTELVDSDGTTGIGEAAPSNRYDENVESNLQFLKQVNPERLSFADIPASMRYLDSVASGEYAAKGALNIALIDGAARRAKMPVYDHLGLGFREGRHLTSFSIGIDTPEVIREKVAEAEPYPILKLKVGSPQDNENLDALRAVAPKKLVRVDANEAWKTKEEALKRIEWLASDGHIELIEQPMPATTSPADLVWLKERSPLPLMADEAYLSPKDIDHCAECYHAVNVKLVKAGGISGAFDALKAARAAGLKTMIGCMIESSVLITAAAHLAELTDYLDIDGNLLTSNDPYLGASARNGRISFADTTDRIGLCVQPRSNQF